MKRSISDDRGTGFSEDEEIEVFDKEFSLSFLVFRL